MIINDDILNWCKEYKGEKFMAMLCDPPYELNFMNKGWDNTGIAFHKETWSALKEHLYPGAFCFAFASTRGLHRMMVAIEDAGFVIHPTIFLYSFGSGFPKATRIDTQIQSKDEQEVVGKIDKPANAKIGTFNNSFGEPILSYPTDSRSSSPFLYFLSGEPILTYPTDPIAKRWIGHRYGLQALKPSCEPIICFQKRYEGKPVNCIVETGAGALNIDGGRIGKEARMTHGTFNKSGNNINKNVYSWALGSGYIQTKKQGRWPSNLIIDKECAERFPMTESQGHWSKSKITGFGKFGNGTQIYYGVGEKENDSGSAARYFKNVEMKIDAADPVFYTSKVSKDERNKGCEKLNNKNERAFKERKLAQCKICGCKSMKEAPGKQLTCGHNEIEYVNVNYEPTANGHPTLKSIDLTTYLATLLLPPLEYAPRRILVPFAGAGSEMIGCLKAGWEEIVGIELIEEYIPIIEARFEYYKKQIELEKSMQLFEPEIMESMKVEKLFE